MSLLPLRERRHDRRKPKNDLPAALTTLSIERDRERLPVDLNESGRPLCLSGFSGRLISSY